MKNNDKNKGIESWRVIKGFPGFAVSDQGRVKRQRYRDRAGRERVERVLEPALLSNTTTLAAHRKSLGHYARLQAPDGRYVHVSMADLVWDNFISEPFDRRLFYMAFKDENPNNCKIGNLYLQPKHEDTFRGHIDRKLATLKSLY